MKKINILTPFNRDENIPELLNFIRAQKDYVRWVPICTTEKKALFDSLIAANQDLQDLVFPVYTQLIPGWDICVCKLNHVIENLAFDVDDYCVIMMDDDLYEPDVMSTLLEHTEDVVFVSMKRGDRTPPAVKECEHPTFTLVARPDHIQICGVGYEQYFVKVKVIKEMRFTNSHCSDGVFAEELKAKYVCAYRPDLYALFNYLQPGRYNK